MPPIGYGALSDDAHLMSDVYLTFNVCLSRTSGLSREQSQWASGLLSLT